MNVANVELCKELYELSEWKDTFNYWERTAGIPAGEPYLAQPELERRYGLWGTSELKEQCPAYDLGYLLRMLPKKLADRPAFWLDLGPYDEETWGVRYAIVDDHLYMSTADTAEDATAKLAIELFKQGILKRQVAA